MSEFLYKTNEKSYKYNNPNCFFANSLLIGKFECYKGKVGGLKLRTVDVIKNLTLDFYQYNSYIFVLAQYTQL